MPEKKYSVWEKINNILFGKPKINLVNDDVVETVIDSLQEIYETQDTYNFSELMGKILYDDDDHFSHGDALRKILTTTDVYGQVQQDKAYLMRVSRYRELNKLMEAMPRLKRALTVLCTNIYAPDYVSNDVFSFNVDEKSKNIKKTDQDDAIGKFNTINDQIVKVERKGKTFIRDTLLMGDKFVEIVNLKRDLQEKRKLLLLSKATEEIDMASYGMNLEEEKITIDINTVGRGKTRKKSFNYNIQFKDFDKFLDGSILFEQDSDIERLKSEVGGSIESKGDNSDKIKDEDLEENLSLKDLYVRVIDPERVIVLGNEDVCFGYIILPPTEYILKDQNSFAGMVQSGIAGDTSDAYQGFQGSQTNINDAIAQELAIKIREKLKTKLGDIIDDNDYEILRTLNKLLSFMSLYVAESQDKNILIRYVSENDMQHFCIDVNKYKPYGTSVFDGVMADAKLYLAGKTAMMIDRIAHARDQRLAFVEIDFTNEVATYIEDVKRALNQQRIVINQDTTIDAIPSLVSNFEIAYMPQKNGKRYIEFDQLDRSDFQTAVEDLKLQRDEMISGLNIPPAYLGVEENIESRATLSFENIIFASMVLDYQKELSEHFTELFRKIYYKIYGEYVDWVDFTLNPPILLIVQTIIDYINNFSATFDFLLNQVGMNKLDIINRFMPYLKQYFTEEKQIENIIDGIAKAGQQSSEAEAPQGFGGF